MQARIVTRTRSSARQPCQRASAPHQLGWRLPVQQAGLRRSEPTCRATEADERPSTKTDAEPPAAYNKEFGYSRKDVILIGVGLIVGGYALYYGLQAAGLNAATAGNFAQLIIFLGLCVGWIGSYLFRVANKKMTYVQQLEDYEQAVMKKRLDEMTEDELNRLVSEVENQKKK